MARTPDASLAERAAALGLFGLLARWHAVEGEPWLRPLIEGEEEERCRRSLERRLGRAALGAFKPMADFDWTHPRKIDREAIEALFDLDFLRERKAEILTIDADSYRTKETHERNTARRSRRKS